MTARMPHDRTTAGPPGADNVLELRNASKNYGRVQALRDVSLEIRRGEVVALLGPNGAGKTTAINLLLGLLPPDTGSVLAFGGDPRSLRNRMRVGTMMQISGIPVTVTVREHLQGFASYYSAPLSVQAAIAAAGLEGLENRIYGNLSGGQKQRLHLALALVGDPEVLFLDEPTTGLDVTTRQALWKLVRNFIASGRTVVLTTHYLEEADALADRIVLIDHGRIVAEGTPAEIKATTAGRRIRAVTGYSLEQARALPGVASASRDGDTLELLVNQAEDVARTLLAADPGLSNLEIGTVGLDEAFISLTTGRKGDKQ